MLFMCQPNGINTSFLQFCIDRVFSIFSQGDRLRLAAGSSFGKSQARSAAGGGSLVMTDSMKLRNREAQRKHREKQKVSSSILAHVNLYCVNSRSIFLKYF